MKVLFQDNMGSKTNVKLRKANRHRTWGFGREDFKNEISCFLSAKKTNGCKPKIFLKSFKW